MNGVDGAGYTVSFLAWKWEMGIKASSELPLRRYFDLRRRLGAFSLGFKGAAAFGSMGNARNFTRERGSEIDRYEEKEGKRCSTEHPRPIKRYKHMFVRIPNCTRIPIR